MSAAEEIKGLLQTLLTEKQVGAVVESRPIQRQGVLQPSEVVINVLPQNPAAATIQLHIDGNDVDVTLGAGTLLEYSLDDPDRKKTTMSRLAEITSAVVSGNFRETLGRTGGGVGSASGEIRTASGVLKSSR